VAKLHSHDLNFIK